MADDHRVTVTNNSPIHGLITLAGYVLSVIVLGIVGLGVYLVRNMLPLVGYVVVTCVCLAFMGAIIFGLVALVKYILKVEVIELGPSGNLIKWFSKVTEYYPLGLKEYKGSQQRERKESNTEIPSLLALLRENILDGVNLLLGYHKDGTARWGTWANVRTFIIGGKSRSGKTVTLVFFIIQALLAGAKVYVCDPHYNKRSGLLKVLTPLLPHLVVARTYPEILQLACDFRNEMHARENGTSEMGLVPSVIVFDEWTKMLRDLDSVETEIVVNLVLACSEEWADFEGYAIISGHEWTARESGGKKGAAFRRSILAAMVHRIDEDYAKFLLQGSKGKRKAKDAPNLPTGHNIFQDTDGELDELIIPFYGSKLEAIIEVANMLQTLPQGPVYPLLDIPDTHNTDTQPFEAVNDIVNDKQHVNSTVNVPMERVSVNEVTSYKPVNTSKLETVSQVVNTEDVNASSIETIIQRMHKQKVSHRVISYTVGLYGSRYKEYVTICEKLGINTGERL